MNFSYPTNDSVTVREEAELASHNLPPPPDFSPTDLQFRLQVTPPASSEMLPRSTGSPFDQQSICSSFSGATFDESPSMGDFTSLLADPMASSRAPFNEPWIESAEFPSPDQEPEIEMATPLPFDVTSFMHSPFAHQQAKKRPRYYTWALSEEEKEDLAKGVEYKNVSEWDRDQYLKNVKESAKELVPPDLDDRDGLQRQKKKQESSESEDSAKNVKHRRRQSWFGKIQTPLRSPSLSPPMQHRPIAHLRVSRDPVTPAFHVQPCEPSYFRNANTPDYFQDSYTCDVNARMQTREPSQHSRTSSHARSPLTNEISFQPRPDITFDNFMVRHVSGTGEAYSGAGNAIKEDDKMGMYSKDEKEEMPKQGKKRLSRMLSLTSLKLKESEER
ncbi:hypothetical protein K469DRAFT_721492 [Zopfia rhizophila CBS 207.26]|uniref:Uncharacterized protein n=1 Tax=Zopfia rhizophila CBS 207.26 TaxID=1314779 RepID=A0A6A6EKE5_9PEZI|nr:hypothetical protein K469DRAFT_721492 [Zopfia rhizophila CBS 207.26]